MGQERGPIGVLDRAPSAEGARERLQKSFDLTAGVRILREDIERTGQILPETRQQVLDEGLSYFVEGIDRASCTNFTLRRGVGGELQYFKNGKHEAYMAMLLEGRMVAKAEAERDIRKAFLYKNAVEDYAHGLKMEALKPGEQHVWASGYRQDIEGLYGKDFMRNECGMNPDRKMGFIYRAYCNEDGSVTLQSQTVDRADDPELMERVLYTANHPLQANGIVSMRALVASYDEKLSHKYGQKTYAGRLGVEKDENAWTKLLEQKDLIEFYFHKLEAFARSGEPLWDMEKEIQDFTYGVWASFKERITQARNFTEDTRPYPTGWETVGSSAIHFAYLQQEVTQAFVRASTRGEVMAGCGGGMRGSGLDIGVPEDMFNQTFGDENTSSGTLEDCEFISKVCPKCNDKNVVTICKNGKYTHKGKGCSS